MKNVQRYKRIRTLALSAGMVLGMMAATFGPQMAHAAALKSAPSNCKQLNAC
jgi:hypothetical protein